MGSHTKNDLGPSMTLLLGMFLSTSCPVHLAEEPPPSRLSQHEEELAYRATSPKERVRRYLAIANARLVAAKKFVERGATREMAARLQGYPAAILGAQQSISWGQDLGLEMKGSLETYHKTLKRHRGLLKRLEAKVPVAIKPDLRSLQAFLEDKAPDEKPLVRVSPPLD